MDAGRSVMLRRASRRYTVLTTAQFDALWQRAIAAGVIDAAVGESQLHDLSGFLSVDPYYYSLLEPAGEAVDFRRVNFMPGVTSSVEIWYSIVEDDRIVYLESVEIHYVSQFGQPYFE